MLKTLEIRHKLLLELKLSLLRCFLSGENERGSARAPGVPISATVSVKSRKGKLLTCACRKNPYFSVSSRIMLPNTPWSVARIARFCMIHVPTTECSATNWPTVGECTTTRNAARRTPRFCQTAECWPYPNRHRIASGSAGMRQLVVSALPLFCWRPRQRTRVLTCENDASIPSRGNTASCIRVPLSWDQRSSRPLFVCVGS